jgi:phosphatidate cytidylyltransferase
MKELGKRVLTALIGIPIALFLFIYGGHPFAVALLIIAGYGMHEFYNMAKTKGYNPIANLTIAMTMILGGYFYLVFTGSAIMPEKSLFLLLPTLIGTILLLAGLFKDKFSAIPDISISIGGIVYIALPLFSLIAIREFNSINNSTMEMGYFVLSMFVAIWACDSAAYFIGKAIGKNKLFPKHSPKKTWEGAIAGFIFGAAAFVGFNLLLNPSLSLTNSIILGSVISVFCQVGDLIESHFKRDAGVKDSSNFFPGHGGFLDRFDGVIYVSPIVYLLLIVLS